MAAAVEKGTLWELGDVGGAVRGIWLQNISGSGTWLSAQILQPRESFYSCWRQNHCRLFPLFSLLVNPPFLLHASDWENCARTLFLHHRRRRAIPSYGDECLKMQTLRRYYFFSLSFFSSFKPEWNSSPSVYLYLSWPRLYLWVHFHYNSITRQGIELSEPLQRWISVEKWFKPSTLLTLPKKQPKDFKKRKKNPPTIERHIYFHQPPALSLALSCSLTLALSQRPTAWSHTGIQLLGLYSEQDTAIKAGNLTFTAAPVDIWAIMCDEWAVWTWYVHFLIGMCSLVCCCHTSDTPLFITFNTTGLSIALLTV